MTNPHPLTEVEVAQVDRDAAIAFMGRRPPNLTRIGLIEKGDLDHDPTVQAFARHRLSTSAQPSTEAVKLADERFPELGIHVPLREYLERTLAGLFGRQPDMSGDQRKRLLPHELRKVEAGAGELIAILSTLRQSPPLPSIDEVERDVEGALLICTGCGSSHNLEALRSAKPGTLSCCPERKMMTVFAVIDEARREALEEAAKVVDEAVEGAWPSSAIMLARQLASDIRDLMRVDAPKGLDDG